jgi:hypothetical protein
VCNSNGLQFQKLTRMSLSSFVWSFLLIITILIPPLLQNAIASEDIFGIEKIYPTQKGGEEWYMDMINPLSDNRFDPYNLLAMEDRNSQDPPLFKIIRNKDNSWKMVPLTDYTSIRMNILTNDGYNGNRIETFDHSKLVEKGYMQSQRDWKNIEMTGYIKLNKFDIDKENGEFQWYNRGGLHDNIECEGVGYKGNLFFDGKTRFAKEQWHVSYDFVDKKDGSEKDLEGNWIGYKYIVYNIEDKKSDQTFVKMENWIDDGGGDSGSNIGQSNWKKVYEYVDNGDWGKEGKECSGKKDQIITWGGPIATFRWDDATDVDFKFLSVREIDPLKDIRK